MCTVVLILLENVVDHVAVITHHELRTIITRTTHLAVIMHDEFLVSQSRVLFDNVVLLRSLVVCSE